MSESIFTPGNFRKGYDGEVRLTLDDGTATPIFTFPLMSCNFFGREGNSYPTMQDASGVRIDKIAGLALGGLQMSGAIKGDRGFDQFLTKSFGPRAATGTPLLPFRATIVPAAGLAAEMLNGVYVDRANLSARFGTDGQTTMLRFSLQALVLDPNNALGAAALGAGQNEGTIGVGVSQFIGDVLSNGAAGNPVIYDGIRSVSISFMNGMDPSPSTYPGQARMASGAAPDQFIGSLGVSQLIGAAQPLPSVAAVDPYPLTLKAPDAAAAHTLRLDMSASYDGFSQAILPGDFGTNGYMYTLFGTNNVNGAGAYPFAASYG